MKSVLLIVNSDFGRGNTIGARFFHIAQALKKKHITYKVIARANYTDQEIIVPWYRNVLVRALNAFRIYVYPRLHVRGFDIWLYDRFVYHKLRCSKETWDVAHVGDTLPKTIQYLQSCGTIVYVDVPIGHYAYSEYLTKKGIEVGARTDSGAKAADESYPYADGLIVPSEFVAKTLHEFANISVPTYIVPFGVALPDVHKIIKDTDEIIHFLFVGAVNKRKGVPQLLTAWRNVVAKTDRAIHLTLCGRVYKEVECIVKEFDDDSTVTFAGFVDVATYFKKSHVFVFPSLLEGSAKAVYEAISYGLPVITTPNAGSVVEDGVNGFIVPIDDPSTLKEKMQYFIDNPEKITQMGFAARKCIEAYTWDRYAKSVIQVYEKK